MKLFLFLTFFCVFCNAQEVLSESLYKGKIGEHEVELYLKVLEDGCPRVYAEGMYKYKSNDKNEWILLNIVYDHKYDSNKQNFTMVEFFNTGVLILNQEKKALKGIWISPNGNKLLVIFLEENNPTEKEMKKVREHYYQEQYYAQDC